MSFLLIHQRDPASNISCALSVCKVHHQHLYPAGPSSFFHTDTWNFAFCIDSKCHHPRTPENPVSHTQSFRAVTISRPDILIYRWSHSSLSNTVVFLFAGTISDASIADGLLHRVRFYVVLADQLLTYLMWLCIGNLVVLPDSFCVAQANDCCFNGLRTLGLKLIA